MRKYTLLIPTLFLALSCHKTNKMAVDGQLYADFAFKPGSYWIYQDSVRGETDSMYVDQIITEWQQGGGCVASNNEPQIEFVTVSIKRAGGNSNDSEIWAITMSENKLSANFRSTRDIVSQRIPGVQLFTYPIQAGMTASGNGCVVTPDSGTIAPVGTLTAGNGGSYPNVAQSAHASNRPSSGLSYNDCFYTSPTVGFVRLVFNHPADSVYRVLNLMRYKTVR